MQTCDNAKNNYEVRFPRINCRRCIIARNDARETRGGSEATHALAHAAKGILWK
jgi:hypothetical protein